MGFCKPHGPCLEKQGTVSWALSVITACRRTRRTGRGRGKAAQSPAGRAAGSSARSRGRTARDGARIAEVVANGIKIPEKVPDFEKKDALKGITHER